MKFMLPKVFLGASISALLRPKSTLLRIAFAICLALSATLDVDAGNWRYTPGNDGVSSVWTAESGNWRAEVDPLRGRLSYLGPKDGPNLLNRPVISPKSPDFGGHRVWLGPQSDWKPFWPPPPNWETQPAALVRLRSRDRLELVSPRGPGKAVAIRRTYRWKGNGVFECEVSWEEKTKQGRQAMQIFQLAHGAVLEARPTPTTEAPHGYVRLPIGTRLTTEKHFKEPEQVTRGGNRLLLRRKSKEEKLGFPVQMLIARWPKFELRLKPGSHFGRTTGEPDGGYNSQIYLGSDAVPLIEMEQLSPRLLPWLPGGRVSQTVLVELRIR